MVSILASCHMLLATEVQNAREGMTVAVCCVDVIPLVNKSAGLSAVGQYLHAEVVVSWRISLT